MTTATQEVLRGHAEHVYAHELTALAQHDAHPRPPMWKLSLRAVLIYLLGGKLPDGTEISPKYVGERRLMEVAVATLATDRALLLIGVPGTAKSWVSEHLAAAISGDSMLLIQGTAGTDEGAIRYGWNYARLLAEGPSEGALVESPVMFAMREGKIARIEELTRVQSDVQDALITVLSEKTLPIPELRTEVQAVRGINIIATANNRDKGVNELSSALKRRFNTVVLPVPDSLEDELSIVTRRVEQLGRSLGLPAVPPALAALYDGAPYGKAEGKKKRAGSLGGSAPSVAAWLAKVRELFPQETVRVLQGDAVDRLGLRSLLLEPELMERLEPDIQMAATLMSLKDVMPDSAKDTARQIVRQVVDDLMKRLAEPLRSAVTGSLNRSQRNTRPKAAEIDWGRTILKNLRHYQPESKTVVPERLVGYGRARHSLKDIVLCIDQSGSMASSVVYAGVFGAVLASLPAVSTRVVVFDTEVVDLSELLSDPVDVLFGVQLGSGTDINLALGYCQQVIRRPEDTILVLISDLYEGGNENSMLGRARQLVESGVRMIALLALDDDGTPGYDHSVAAAYAGLGIPAFACTPEHFPDLMATAIGGGDLMAWAAGKGIALARGEGETLSGV